MAILILSNTKGKEMPYAEWLAPLNEELYLLCSPDHDLQNGSYKKIIAFDHYAQNSDVVTEAEKILNEVPINYIVAKAECDLLRAAALRDKFKIPGQTYEQAQAFRDKFVMKTIARQQNIPVADFILLKNKEDAIQFSEAHQFPVVIKPTDGAGSIDTVVIKNKEQLLAMSEEKFPEKLLERFIAGEMYHIDGLIIDGDLKFIYPTKYLTSCLAYQESGSLKTRILADSDPLCQRLINFVKNTLEKMPTPKNTTFHAEVFHTPNDELFMCEIASRTGGGRIRKTLEIAFDVNIDHHWIQTQCGIPLDENRFFPSKPQKLVGFILIPPQPKTLLKSPVAMSLPGWVAEYRFTGEIGKNYAQAQRSSDAIATIIVTGNSDVDIENKLIQIEDWFVQNTVWE